jgi:DNA mismatch repair ATPase MutS
MTDRVNMRMAGVPESSFSYWASKFLALGYKITKVDQAESSLALAKRKKEHGPSTAKKVRSTHTRTHARTHRERERLRSPTVLLTCF